MDRRPPNTKASLVSVFAASSLSIVGFASFGRTETIALAPADKARNSLVLHRLQTNALSRWQQMAQKLSSCSFDYTIVETNRGNRVDLTGTKHVIGQILGDSFLFKDTIDATAQVSIAARNRDYEFALARSGEAPWSISWQNNRRGVNTPVDSAHQYYAGMLKLPWSISAVPLEKLVASPRFSVRDAKVDGNGMVQLQFKVQPSDEHPDPLQNLDVGTIVLDSVHDWAITKYEVTYANKMVGKLKLAYGPAGPPELQKVDFELVQSPTTSNSFQIHSTHYDWNPPSQEDFTLSAFGLPEFHEPGRSKRPKILINVGLVCLLTGLILYYRTHHASA